MDIEIRPMTADEWELFRDLRLRALLDAPDAFRGTHDQESQRPDTEWHDMLSRTAEHPDGHMFVAIIDGVPAGTMFVRADRDDGVAHVGAMWVAPEARRCGLGRGLLDAADRFARDAGVAAIELAVTHDNGAAELLYASAGFEPTGRSEPLREGSPLSVHWLRRALAD